MADSDDWRVTISGERPGASWTGAAVLFPASGGRTRSGGQVGRSVAVGAGYAQISDTRALKTAARDAERIALDVPDQHGIAVESALHRWHPIEEQWENPDVPMPQTEAERQAEHQRLEDTDARGICATGKAQVACPG